MPFAIARLLRAFALLAACCGAGAAAASDLSRTIATVKGSVIGVGSVLQTRSPAMVFTGTGFVVGDGLSVITNAHVVPDTLDSEKNETLGVLIARGAGTEFRPATVVALDRTHGKSVV